VTFGDRLTQLRKENGYTTRKSFAEKLNIPETTLRNYETDEREAGHTFLKQMSDFFNVSCDYLLGLTDDREKTESYPLKKSEYDRIEKYRLISEYSPDGATVVDTILDREYSIANQLKQSASTIVELPSTSSTRRLIEYYHSVSAGTGQVIFDDVYPERITIPNDPKYKRAAYAVKVNGHSMEPTYSDGDMLLIEPSCEVDIGEIGIFNVGGQAYVKKLGHGELISLNKEYGNIKLTEESNCMGRVVDKL